MLRTLNEIPACQQAGELFLAKIRTLNFEKLLSSGGQKGPTSLKLRGVKRGLGESLPAGRQGIFARHRFSAAAEFRASKAGAPHKNFQIILNSFAVFVLFITFIIKLDKLNKIFTFAISVNNAQRRAFEAAAKQPRFDYSHALLRMQYGKMTAGSQRNGGNNFFK